MFNGKKVISMLVVLGLLMVSGIVYGEEVPQRRIGANALELTRDIKILEMINELELTEEQITKILPVLKKFNEVITLTEKESVELLQMRKGALLNDEPMQVNVEDLRRRATIRAQELKVARETLKLQFMKVLSLNQMQKIQKLFSPMSNRSVNQRPQGIQNRLKSMNKQSANGLRLQGIKRASQNRVVQKNLPSEEGLDLKTRIIEKVKDFQNLPQGDKLKVIEEFRKGQQRQGTTRRGIASSMAFGSNIGQGRQMLSDLIRVLEEKLKVLSKRASLG